MKKLVLVCFVVVGFVLVGCHKEKPTIIIQDADKDITINVGEEKQVTATVHEKYTVEWSSEDPHIATVSDGLIKGLNVGTTTIVAKIKDEDVSEMIKVTVKYCDPKGITITGDDVVRIGEEILLEASINPVGALQIVTWESSDEMIATVTDGVVTGISYGEVTITAYAKDDHNIKDTKTIKVILPNPQKLVITGPSELMIGEDTIYTVTQTPANASNDVVWSVSDNEIAQINHEGKFIALKPGIVTIICKAKELNSVQAMQVVHIYDYPTAVKFNPDNYAVKIQEKVKVYVDVLPLTAKQDIDWEISDHTIATIDSNGFVTGVSAGKVTLTAYVKDNHNIKESIEITVTLQDPIALVINGTNILIVGEETTYTITPYPSNANPSVRWSSSDNEILEIDETGKVVAHKEGYVTITAIGVKNVNATKQIRVKLQDPETIKIIGPDHVNVGEEVTYQFEITPEDASRNIHWEVRNKTIAQIDENGVLKAIKSGEVELVAFYLENNAVKDTLIITVYDEPEKITFYGPDVFVEGGTGIVTGKVSGKNSLTTDQSQLEFSVDDSSILTIDQTGKVKALKTGTAIITIVSTINPEVKVEKEVSVVKNYEVSDLSEVIVDSNYQALESFISPLDEKTHIIGYDAFSNIADACEKVENGAIIRVQKGTYIEDVIIDKDDITIIADGEVINTGIITINKNVKGLTIDGLSFKGKGSIVGSNEGGIENFTFRNNHIYNVISSNFAFLSFYVASDEVFNNNFLIYNNIFEVANHTTFGNGYIRGGNIKNLQIVGNYFKGVSGEYTDAIRLGGTGEDLEGTDGGCGVGDKLIIKNNHFIDIGQRAIYIRLYTANKIAIENNIFDNIGDATYGGPIQIQGANATSCELKVWYNTFQNINAKFVVRLNNQNVNNSWEAKVNYNQFENINDDAKFIEGYNQDILIKAENNYYHDLYSASNFINVIDFALACATKDDYEKRVNASLSDSKYGEKVYTEDFENHAIIYENNTIATFNNLKWLIKDVCLNPDHDDKNGITETDNQKMLRLNGKNHAYLELEDFYDGIIYLSFSAKYYNFNHANAILKISKMVDYEWIEIETITLTNLYETYYVNINEIGKVKIKIEAMNNSVNLDNLAFHQFIDVTEKKEKYNTLKANIIAFLGDKNPEYPGAVGTDLDTYLANYGNSGYTITHGNQVLFIGYKAFIELRAMEEGESELPWEELQPYSDGNQHLNYGVNLTGEVNVQSSVPGSGVMYHNGNDSPVIIYSKTIYGYQGTAWGFTYCYGVILVNQEGLIKKNFTGEDLEKGIWITLESGDYLISNYQADSNALGGIGFCSLTDFAEGKTISISFNENLVYKG